MPSDAERVEELEGHLRGILGLLDEVLNVGGYIGESTQKEIEYAKRTGKRVLYLEPYGPVEEES
jgi:hypothetical protein